MNIILNPLLLQLRQLCFWSSSMIYRKRLDNWNVALKWSSSHLWRPWRKYWCLWRFQKTQRNFCIFSVFIRDIIEVVLMLCTSWIVCGVPPSLSYIIYDVDWNGMGEGTREGNVRGWERVVHWYNHTSIIKSRQPTLTNCVCRATTICQDYFV